MLNIFTRTARTQCRYLSTTSVPQPSAEVPTLEVFLKKIGRKTHESVASKIPDWQSLFTMSSIDFKTAGISVRERKYLLRWREKYRQGEELYALRVMRKIDGGERKRKAMGKARGITRDSRHKRNATGAKRSQYRQKRKFELGRQPANTKIGPKRVHEVRVRGGNKKYRALRLDSGNFSWGSESISRKCRVIQVVYHPSNNELVRTNSLTKSAIVQIDATPLRQWYEAHYGQTLGKGRAQKKQAEGEEEAAPTAPVTRSKQVERKFAARQVTAAVEGSLDTQFAAGRLYAAVSSRPGQSGRCDGYILEGEELSFLLKAIHK